MSKRSDYDFIVTKNIIILIVCVILVAGMRNAIH